MKTPKLPALESEPTNDTAALACYALEWRDAYLAEQSMKDKLLEALEYWFDSKATPSDIAAKARSAIAKARGES